MVGTLQVHVQIALEAMEQVGVTGTVHGNATDAFQRVNLAFNRFLITLDN